MCEKYLILLCNCPNVILSIGLVPLVARPAAAPLLAPLEAAARTTWKERASIKILIFNPIYSLNLCDLARVEREAPSYKHTLSHPLYIFFLRLLIIYMVGHKKEPDDYRIAQVLFNSLKRFLFNSNTNQPNKQHCF